MTLKKATYILFIFILLLQAGGLLFVYHVQQVSVKIEMRNALEARWNSGFQKLHMTVSEFKKAKINSFEIYYKGRMYDYKSVVIKSDSVEILAIHDTKEEGILEIIKELSENTSNSDSEYPHQLLKLLSLIYIGTEAVQPSILTENSKCEYTFFGENTLIFHGTFPSPPPEII